MTDLNALADWLEKSPTATLGFVKDGLTKVVTPKYLLKSDVDWIIAQARAAASSQAGVETAPPSQEPVAWRYKCHDGSKILMLKRLTDAQKARGYFTGEDGEDEVDGDEPIIGPFHWAEETPLYTHPTPARDGNADALRNVVAHLAAAISLLERTPKAKKAAPSDKMFGIMLSDYRKSLEVGRAALAAPAPAQQSPDPIWKTELSEIIGHLGSAIVQSCAKDDQIIMDHVKAAHEIAKIVRRKA